MEAEAEEGHEDHVPDKATSLGPESAGVEGDRVGEDGPGAVTSSSALTAPGPELDVADAAVEGETEVHRTPSPNPVAQEPSTSPSSAPQPQPSTSTSTTTSHPFVALSFAPFVEF